MLGIQILYYEVTNKYRVYIEDMSRWETVKVSDTLSKKQTMDILPEFLDELKRLNKEKEYR